MTSPRSSELTDIPSFSRRPFPGRIRELFLRDTNIIVISVIVTNFLRALSGIVLTRLLVPEVFGIAGIISSVLFTFAMMSDLGLQAFVVRHPDGDKPRFLNTIWTMAILRSVVLTGAGLLAAPTIASLFGKVELTPIIRVAAFAFIIEGMSSLTLLTALRHGRVLRLSLLELAVFAMQVFLSFGLAYVWPSYWAILASMLIASTTKMLLTYFVFPNSIRKPAFDKQYIRDLWGFARFVAGSSLITLLLAQSDKLILARLMPMEQFGFYILGGNLASAPLAFTTAYASRVLYPFYSQAWREGSKNLCALFYAKRRLPSLLYAFAAGGLIGCAPLVVDILYDPRYAAAAFYLQILAVSAFFSLASNSAHESLTATGHIRVNFQASIVKLVWFAITGPLGFKLGGIVGLVIAAGLMEIPAMAFKWFRLHQINLLDLRQELLFIGAGLPGIATGIAATKLISPLI